MRRILAIGILVAAPSMAQSATPVPSTFLGMSGVGGEYPQVTTGTLAHSDFAWPRIEPSRGEFNFQFFDNYVTNAQLHGLVDPSTNTVNMAMTLAAGTPAWAVANQSTCGGNSPGSCTAPPDDIQDWNGFLTAVIQHYNGKTQPHIKYYELWNEMNITLWWTGTNAQMLALAQAAYPIIHQDPYSLLLTPSVAGPVGAISPTSQVNAMTQYLQAGGWKYADGGAFHGYIAAGVSPFPMPEQDTTSGCKAFVGCHGSIVTIATQMRAVFDQNGLAGKPIFQTEGSWGNLTVTDPDTQVQWISRYNLLEAGLHSSLNLQMAAWFTWAAPSFGWGNIADSSLNPTPAGIAYNQVYNWVVGSTIAQPCSSVANGTFTCILTRAGGYTAQAVWNTQGSLAYSPGPGYTQYRDLSGNTNPIPASGSVTIGTKPILVEGVTGTTPAITLAANAEGEGILAAPNTWMELKGLNLAPLGHTRPWQSSDFVGGQMPVELDGVSATVNGKSAYVSYISPAQVNILTPPDAMLGPVQVMVTNNGLTSAAATLPAQSLSPSFFVIDGGPYVVAQHSANYSLAGPTSLYPGYTTPAKPGETLVLYANGFGPVSPALVSGSSSQNGSLSPLPGITIGGIVAKVAFAGINGLPGLFQFNVVVPASASNGDNLLTATYNGATTQPSVLITVQH